MKPTRYEGVFYDEARDSYAFRLNAKRSSTGGRQQVMRRGFARAIDARKARDSLQASMSAGRGQLPSAASAASFLLNRWLPFHDSAAVAGKPTTKACHRNAVRHLVRRIGDVRLDELTGEHLDLVYAALRDLGRSESLVHAVHVAAGRAFGQAVRWRLLSFNPASDATPAAQLRPEPKAWTPDEVRAVLAAAVEDRWAALFVVAASTALRRGELVGMRWSDLDLEAGALTISRNVTVADGRVHEGSPKTGKARRLRLDADTVTALRAWRRQQAAERLAWGEGWPEAGDVWTWQDGQRVHPNVVTRTWRRIVEAAGVPPLTLHALRHSWATNALAAGIDVKDVSTRLGHSSTRITYDVYVAPSSDRDAAAAETVASLYRATP